MPEDRQAVERVTPLGDWFFVFFNAEAVDQDDPRSAVVYDASGHVRWSHTNRGLFDARVSRSGELVYLQEGGFRAVSVRDGDEQWAHEASLTYVAERGDVLVLSSGDDADG